MYFFPLEKGITRIMMQRKMLLKKDCVHSLESKQDACLLLEEELMLVWAYYALVLISAFLDV